jgi:hypothetical protein
MEHRRSRLQSILCVEDRREELIFDLDQREGVLRYRLFFGRDDGDLVADKAQVRVEWQ